MSSTDKRPLKVFLCHASADKPKVRELYRTLKRRGVQPWLDAENLIPGQNWEVEIPKAIISADAIIVCLSPNSVDKEGYVQTEIKFALDKAMEMPEGRIFLIPAKLEECDLPFSLRQYQAVNLYEKEGYTKLMRALKLRASQLERNTVQLPKEEEIAPEIKKVVEEKKPVKPKQEELVTKTFEPSREPSSKSVDVGGVNITGSDNVINIGIQENTETAKPAIEKPQLRNAKSPHKPNRAIIVALIGLVGTIVAAMLGSPLIEKWFSPAPIATEMATTTFTLTSQSIVSSKTIEPNQTPAKSLTLTSTLLPIEIIDAKGVSMVLVPASEFTMGSDNGDVDEKPVHTVYLDAFWIDKTEVTNKMYSLCVSAGACKEPTDKSSWIQSNYYRNSSFDNYPVIYVDWYMAETYCEWAGHRLPTEAQWEKAARGTDGRTYPWGNTAPNKSLLNYTNTEGIGDVTEVGKYPNGASPYGAMDMAGNVFEWVSSLYRSYPYDAMDGRENLDSSDDRVVRGGGWERIYDNSLRSANRNGYHPTLTLVYVGFRCAKNANP
jgi:formylglycine-generating enzyme required for sulfatase activity